jgi:hypothetical protein
MNTFILVYGLEKNETRSYMESLLASNCKNFRDVHKVIQVAQQHGFHSFRIANYNDGHKPDFTKTLNV